ncbi:MAG: response regulator, partial [Clostridiales bacterium]|nr:response regulator [Clostridiales bacterium]
MKKKILIVDASELNRALLSDMLSDRFEIIEAENGQEALAILHEHEMEISLMLLDIVMPVMDGFDVLAMMNKNGWIESTPVIMISSETGGSYIDRAYKLGAIDYISRPFDERTVNHRVTSNYMLSLKQNEMQQLLSNEIYEKEKDNRVLIEILSHIVEFRNGESGLHVLHVHVITEMLLNRLVEKTDKYDLTQDDIRMISTASALHDIGKISIPTKILNKPARLTPEEFEKMKTHTVEGERILNNVPAHRDEPLVRVSRDICRWHHERFDGRGYPDGLAGDNIPISAQVVSLADVYDALTSRRVYKDAYSPKQAIKMIENGECGAFNPLLIECLKDIAAALKHELKIISYGNATEASINNSVNKMLKSTGTDVSRRMIKQIEHERMKYKYLADITHELTFEYVASPEMIKMSDWSAESLGIPVTIIDPLNDDLWCSIFDKEDFARWINAIKSTTPDNPVVTEKLLLN